MIKKLKDFLKQNEIDFFILPNSDEFFCEYIPSHEKRVKFISNFTGSNATIIFSQEKSYFFTDGRYIIQAQNELDLKEFTIFNIAQISVFSWLLKNRSKKQKIALDAKLTSLSFIKTLQNLMPNLAENLIFLPNNPIDEIWQDRLNFKTNSRIYELPIAACGEDSISKRLRIAAKLEENEAILISRPENLCWLLNIRASDVEFSPLLLAYGLLFKSGKMVIFLEKERKWEIAAERVEVIAKDEIQEFFSRKNSEFLKVIIDENTTNCWFHSLLKQANLGIKTAPCAIEIAKSVKNKVEIEGARLVHELDAIAIIKFLVWLESAVKSGDYLDEILVAKKLLEFRQKAPSFRYPSFETIAGFAENGAIIHYKSTAKTNKKLVGNSLFLLDSGGQYLSQNFCGTTDITRTLIFGKPSESMIRDYSLVLKGHLALARVKFPRKTTGTQLDSLARFYLWQFGKDYDHGTGHGVGAFMSVHEGPCSISKRGNCELLPGMILSNEPGFYEVGKYGIRLENLQLVQEFDEKFLCFETLSLVPFSPELIDFSMLTYPEKKWLYEYHKKIIDRLKNRLEISEIGFLQRIFERFS